MCLIHGGSGAPALSAREEYPNMYSAPAAIRGKLLVDGYSILHELYDKCKLEWASGGCYADQHKAIVDSSMS